jgi:hypothetical protein
VWRSDALRVFVRDVTVCEPTCVSKLEHTFMCGMKFEMKSCLETDMIILCIDVSYKFLVLEFKKQFNALKQAFKKTTGRTRPIPNKLNWTFQWACYK